MRKIAILTTEYPPYKGGVGRFMSEIAQANPEEFPIVYAPSHIGENVIAYSDARVKTYNYSRFFWPRWLPILFQVICDKKNFTHLLASSVLPFGTICYILKKVFSKPYFIVVHGMDVSQLTTWSWKFFLAKLILRNADLVIANSSYTQQLLSRFKLPNATKTTLHPQAYCTPENTTPAFPHELNSKIEGKRVFLSVSRLVARKNVSRIIKAARHFTSDENIIFIIVGNGPEYHSLRRQAHNLTNITFLTEVNDNELAWLYKHSRAAIFIPYEGSGGDVEGFGISAIEPNTFGIPVIASKSGGVNDAVEDGKGSLCIDPFDVVALQNAIQRLAYNDEEANKLGQKGFERNKKLFSAQHFQRGTQKIFSVPKYAPVSVVIPAYNAEHTLKKCIDSLLYQTVLPQEIIVVDDGSKDNTKHVAESFKDNILFLSQKNQGPPIARNAGAAKATQDYLLFVDADMTLHPRMIEREYSILRLHDDTDFIYSSFFFGWKRFHSVPFDAQRLQKHNYIHTSSLLRARCFPGFDPHLRRHQDWDLWLTITKRGGRGTALPDFLYTIHPKQNRISHWLPSIVYQIPYAELFFPQLKRYNESARIIKQKHNLPA